MKLLGTILLWLIALIVVALLSLGLTLYMYWPLWIAVAIFCACIGCYFLLKFVRRTFIMMRSRSKLAQMSDAELGRREKQASPEALLTRKWKAAIATLRGSSLKRQGNPLYVLPWYMVIGKSGTGKTTALTRARLSSPIQKLSQSARVEQTANYDWWYFDQAVVIDCAGRYVDSHDVEQDRREWELGLDLLARYRPKEGLDGLVLAISADRLIHPDKDALIEEGRVVRTRIEQLIQLFGTRFPIYVLVTKCDQLYGLEEWATRLPENALEQAMGYLCEEIAAGGEAKFLDDAFNSMDERLQKLRIALVARSPSVAPELLMFPNELESLKPRLAIFLRACLAEDPYLERPFLRGLFFSSGLQEGGAVSSLLGQALPPVPAHPNANAGLFLHDFFGRILPRDRYISRPAQLVNRWRRVTRNIGVMAWLLLCLAVGILITVSFANSMHTITLVRDERPYDAAFSGRIEDDVPTLASANESLQGIERSHRNWLSDWVVISANVDALEARLKQNFVGNFRKYILPVTYKNYQDDFARVQASDANHELPNLILNMVRYVNLLQARLQGADRDALQALPQPVHIVRYSPQLDQQLNQLTISHLAWSPINDGYLSDLKRVDQLTLDQAAYADPQMTWLVGLVPDNGSIAPVKASDFWNNSVPSGSANAVVGQPMVPAAFTRAGKQAIDGFLDEMQKSVDNTQQFVARRAAFESWYRDQRILAWQKFVADFATAQRPLSGEADWRAAMGVVTGTQSPYYRVIDRVADEFKEYDDQDLPSWLLMARQFQQLRGQVTRAGATNQAVKVAGAIDSVGGKAMRQTLDGGPQLGGRIIKNNLSAVDTLNLYFSEVNKLGADSVNGTGKDYQIAADFHQYSLDPAAKPSAVQSAAQRLVQLKTLVGHDGASDEAVWRLIEGPLDFALAYVEQQASCEVQKNWQASVLFPLQSAPDKATMLDQLYGAKGSVWAFADGSAKPFLVRDAKRFDIVQTLGYSVPFTDAFLPMLNGAVDQRVTQLVTLQRQDVAKQNEQLQAQQDQLKAQQDQLLAQQTLGQLDKTLSDAKVKADAATAQPIQLTITAQPTGINPGATEKPFATILSIQCAAGAQLLNNYNFPVSSSFAWSPGQCGDVTLQIKIDKLVLTKKYAGPLGVAHFVSDFRAGVRQFQPADFPSAQPSLDALGVRQIAVRYTFDGQDAILRAAQQIDDYETLKTTTAQEKQRIQDQQFQATQQGIDQKLAVLPAVAPPLPINAVSTLNAASVSLPQQIVLCWNQQALGGKPQDMTSVISQLVRNADPTSRQLAPGVTLLRP